MKDPQVFLEWLDKVRDLKAVDMEVAGVFEAARSIDGDVPVIAIRGLSDVVGFRRDTAWTYYACSTAASFCKALITSGILNAGSEQVDQVMQFQRRPKPTNLEKRSRKVVPPLTMGDPAK